ncbi:hypothetical protein [Pectinatus sottacetonis]|uniref:hypothetical protein n=1 Tax=Pectinatus sottacetonis TaxID=1002795 RepID=UPI0018C608B0|nr:hypothetical protein [Pectinatus sottacetonis]
MHNTLFSSIYHVTLHDGKNENYTKQDLTDEMYNIILNLFPQTISPKGAEIKLCNKTYHIQTMLDSDGGITKLYIKMQNPSWAQAHLMTCGYSQINYTIFSKILAGKLGEKCTIEQPRLPYLISRVEPGVIMDKKCLEWLSPFARCIAWAALDPQNYFRLFSR